MKDESESVISPGHFIPLAEQHHLMAEIDFAVLNQIIQSEHLNTHKIALNINQQTFMHKPDFTHYMDILKKVNKRELKNLSIEFHEMNLITNLDSVKEAVHQLKMLGLSIGVDNVGKSFAPLHYMNDLSIDYVKLHGSYTHHVDDNQSKQFFIHYFNEMAETMEIKVIATQVESQSDWERLNRLNIHYGQGRYLAPVEKL
jgi:EAL domain-containing protein (putative c-di-GMP-specific phosphodiesterase class I)